MQSRNSMNYSFTFDDLLGTSPLFSETVNIAKLAAKSEANVLIQGNTGTGKELFAQSIHNSSRRKNKPFTPINCSAIPKDIVESILFGTSPGSFTGSMEKKGLFEETNGGTLFLDEINSLDYTIQAKLLRVLNSGYFRKIGDAKEIKVDVRILSSSNEDLYALTERNMFRKDLFFRLSVLNINLPDLKDRKRDIIPLAYHFINHYNKIMNKKISGISKEASKVLLNHNWNGNIRELRNTIEATMVTGKSSGTIEAKDITPNIIRSWSYNKTHLYKEAIHKYGLVKYLENHEIEIIEQFLSKNKGNLFETSKELGITNTTLQNKIKKYKIKK